MACEVLGGAHLGGRQRRRLGFDDFARVEDFTVGCHHLPWQIALRPPPQLSWAAAARSTDSAPPLGAFNAARRSKDEREGTDAC